MKLLALKLLTLYLIFLTTFSTIFILYNVGNLQMHGSNAVLQNIICENYRTAYDDYPIERLQRNQEEQVHGVKSVIKSLKNSIYTNNYRNDFPWYGTSKTKEYDKLLSPYIGQHYNLMQSLFLTNRNKNTQFEDRIEQQIQLKLKFTAPKLILVLSQSSGIINQEIFMNSKCHVTDCLFTTDVKMAENADAIIFLGPQKRLGELQNRRKQIWIYHSIEAPVHNIEFETSMIINWTSTYRSDSVIPTPYAKFVTFPSIRRLPEKPPKNFAANKIKLAAIIVSNCHSKNGRLDFVNELQKFAKIDVFGKCGRLDCDGKVSTCFQMLQKKYKFYLSFENSNCREYITEKFFQNALQHDVVPIVMGAHPDDYKKVAPPNSFIHVDEFDSPRQLAEYMHILDNNDDLYNEYFRWKGTGEFIDTKFVCRLCSMLQIAPNFPTMSGDIRNMIRQEDCIDVKSADKWATWKIKIT